MTPGSTRSQTSSTSEDAIVYIVDDDESIRRSLGRLFRSAGLKSQGFDSAEAYLAEVRHEGPSCLVLDVRMPGMDGLELQEELDAYQPQIVFITGHGDVPICAHAMRTGAVDFLAKPVDDEELLGAVHRVLTRAARARKAAAEKAAVRARLARLTAREFEVMQRVIAGFLNKQIAGQLGTAEKTIKVHRGRMMEKMGADSVADLVRMAQVGGVTPVPRPSS